MPQPRILAFAGSARKDSYNKKMVQVAAEAARSAGAEVTFIDLNDFDLPLFNEDLESAEGVPENAQKLKALFFEHDGFIIACPEYNSSITPLLKNVIDWVSRREEGESPLQAYQGKTTALLAASPGGLGGLRGLVHVRSILSSIGVLVIPKQFALSNANNAFDDNGQLTDDKQQSIVTGIAQNLVEVTSKLCG